MKKALLTLAIILLVAGTTQASLQGRIGELLGLEGEAPASMALGEPIIGQETAFTAWFMGTSDLGSQENEYVGRIGVQLEDVETGLESDWRGIHGEQSYGAYVLMHLIGDAGVLGTPYLGYHASIIDAEDGGFYGPIAGTKYELGQGVETIVEAWYRDFTGNFKATAEQNDVWKVFAGVRMKF